MPAHPSPLLSLNQAVNRAVATKWFVLALCSVKRYLGID